MPVTDVVTQVLAADPAGLLPARQQMAFSLGWHIILACFGVAFPAIIFTIHLIGIRRDDPDALMLARKWGKVSAVLFAIGAVSGTVLSFEMGLLWPGLMGPYGDVLGLPFAFEGLAFFTEAIFLGIYLYGWDRMPPKRHLLMIVPMAITGVVGTYCVIAVNAWMNVPVGFDVVDGQVTNVEPWAVLFSSAAFWQFLHMWIAAYMVTGFMIAAVYAVGMLRGRRDARHRLGFTVPFAFASVSAVIQPVVGHLLGARIAEAQPAKLAAFELATETESPSPLRIGGVLIDGTVRWAIDIPYLGSLIARSSFTAPVEGLDSFPPEDRPPVNITHWAFQTMVGIGMLLMLAVIVYWVARWRGRDLVEQRWFLRFVAASGVLAIIAMEAGWIATEVGRQPWVVQGFLRTTDAAGDNPGLWWLLAATLVVYTGMTIGAIVVLRSMARRWRAGDVELPSPYGPESALAASGEGTGDPAGERR
ncbi:MULTISPECIES: cytochrome ubiquinol oxidase subunit I [unclassified Nocardioides]|uniref:cytochrome ubiquinol oxidase subunit I n=1 Tax=unclassified Nocardioides TaxID=2615069 RepID=UPI001E43AD8C|nr:MULTISPECIES: cytochrome ubiquinol oxidase subunit I [unclassified Nocardioides]